MYLVLEDAFRDALLFGYPWVLGWLGSGFLYGVYFAALFLCRVGMGSGMRGRRCLGWVRAWLGLVLLCGVCFLVVLAGMAGWRWMDGLWMMSAGMAWRAFGCCWADEPESLILAQSERWRHA